MRETGAAAARITGAMAWVSSVLMVSALSVVVITSLAALMFGGDLEVLLPLGMASALVGAILVNLVVALVPRGGALVALPSAAMAVIMAILLTDVVAGMGAVPDPVLAATAALAMLASALVTGTLLLCAGAFRLGELARYVPYPVFAGFLGAVGLLIFLGALDMAAQPSNHPQWAAGAMGHWVPALVLGGALLVATRIWKARALLPLAILGSVAAFHLGLWLLGMEIATAAERGLLLMAPDTVVTGLVPPGEIARHADVSAVVAQWPGLGVLAVIALIASPLSASGIEVSTGREVNLDQDLRATGLGNLAAALGGGFAAYHNVGATLLLHRLSGGAGGRTGLGVALTLALVLAGGIEFLALLPRVVCAALLVYVGLELIDQWVLAARRRMPPGDFAILLGIVGVGVSVGFLEAVAVGMVAAIALFIYTYARLDFIRTTLDGSLRQSTTERGGADLAAIIAEGSGVRIFELQGFVFFGVTQKLLRRLSTEIAAESAPIRAIIVDFRRTQGVDVSAAIGLAGLSRRCADRGVRLWLTGAASDLDGTIRRADPQARHLVAPTLDAALASEEDWLLARHPAAGTPSDLTALMARIEAAGIATVFARERVAAGTVVYRQDAPSDSLVVVEAGRMAAMVRTPGGEPLKVATILPGALIGEIGFFGGVARTATVVAEIDSVLRVVRHPDLAELSRRDAELGAAFLRCGAAQMAQRLARTNALLRHTNR